MVYRSSCRPNLYRHLTRNRKAYTALKNRKASLSVATAALRRWEASGRGFGVSVVGCRPLNPCGCVDFVIVHGASMKLYGALSELGSASRSRALRVGIGLLDSASLRTTRTF